MYLSDWAEGKRRSAGQRLSGAWNRGIASCRRFGFSTHTRFFYRELGLHDQRKSCRCDSRGCRQEKISLVPPIVRREKKESPMRRNLLIVAALLLFGGCAAQRTDLSSCTTYALGGLRKIADERSGRFLGKVEEDMARCRGGEKAVALRSRPWIDWQNYWAAGDAASKAPGLAGDHLSPNGRGIDGALLDFEYQRIELIKFNLFDNTGTYEEYVRGRDGVDGPALKTWDQFRLPKSHLYYSLVGGDGPQLCRGELMRFRTLTGICNDIKNPLMGSTWQPFARNVELDAAFPDIGNDELVKNRHANRLGLLKPDHQVISRKLLTRAQSDPEKCREGYGLPGFDPTGNCDYKKAPFFNVLAAFWIQFMTHDWFSHSEEGHNAADWMTMGCATQLVNNKIGRAHV